MINILNTIGNTPTVRLREMERYLGISARLYAKAELMNPGGSIKDRAALAVIRDAEKRRLLNSGRIVEATSGNMGIALAMIGAPLGYRVTIVMPEGASEERELLIRAYGGKVIRVMGGMSEAISNAEIIAECEGAFMPRQFENPVCVECHYRETAVEIRQELHENIDVFIAGVGTGATLTGVGRYLKERGRVKIVAVEPSASAVLGGKEAAAHAIEGIGAGFVPKLYDRSIVDEIIAVSDEEAIEMTRTLAKREGILAGISSGANIASAARVGKRGNMDIVIPLPDRGERYFSKGVFHLD